MNYKNYQLIHIREEDIMLIMKWRNEQIKILRQNKKLTTADQKKYYEEIIKPSYESKKPTLILFSLLFNEKLIAYGGLTNIDWVSKRSELSFLDKTGRTKNSNLYKEDFNAFINLIKKVAFKNLRLHKIFAETYEFRLEHIKILEKNGFEYEGRLKEHVIIDGIYTDSLIHGLLEENI